MFKLIEKRPFLTLTWILLFAFSSFAVLHYATFVKKQFKQADRRYRTYLKHFSKASKTRPKAFGLSKLFGVCSESQNEDQMVFNHIKVQKFLSEDAIIDRTQDTESYFQQIPSEGFRPIQEEEIAFPLAFVHLIHHEVGIFELALATIYRPQDYHCIQVDAKASKIVYLFTKINFVKLSQFALFCRLLL